MEAPEIPLDSLETRDRLLEAAGEIFAEHGFHRTTVREICNRAGAKNGASVNYYFRDKQGLYVAVIQHWLRVALEKYPPDMGLGPDATPEQRLHSFVRSFLYRLLDRGAPAWHGRLMVREMLEPTEASDMLLRETVRPMAERLERIVRDLLGRDASEEVVRHCISSVVGQCCHYRHAESMIAKLYPQQQFGPADIDRLADHITRFSLAGISAYREKGDAP